MNPGRDLDRNVTDWLYADATSEGADRVLAATLVRVARVRQERRPGHAGIRSYGRLAFAAGFAAIALMVVGVVGKNPSSNTASAAITGVWLTGPGVAFTAELPPDAPEAMYWRAAMFDDWSGFDRSWSASDATQTAIGAGASILDSVREPVPAGIEISVRIVPGADRSGTVLAPGIPASVDQGTTIESTGAGGSLVRVDLSRSGTPYTITAVRPALESDGELGGVTVNKLGAAGTEYPPGILTQYAVAPATGELGPESLTFINDVRAAVGNDPYRIAALMVERFKSPAFKYDVDVRSVDCAGRGFTECFLHEKRGFCMYFATAMTLLLRQEGIPARLVQGYLPGDRVGTTETVRVNEAHAWVEVYFPGWGWWAFDPTPGP
jgi:hypothetical protein